MRSIVFHIVFIVYLPICNSISQSNFQPFGQAQIHLGFGCQFNTLIIGANIGLKYKYNNGILGTVLSIAISNGYLSSKVNSNIKINYIPTWNDFIPNYSLSFFFIQKFNKNINNQEYFNFRFFNFLTGPLNINSFKKSLGISTTFALIGTKLQQIGSFNFKINDFAFTYYNDGPPFNYILIGDSRDRWWTGGCVIEYVDKKTKENYTITYERYTGYQPNSFEISNILLMNQTLYTNNEDLYNLGFFNFGLKSRTGITANISIYGDYTLDLQNVIHRYLTKNPIHKVTISNLLQLGVGYQSSKIY